MEEENVGTVQPKSRIRVAISELFTLPLVSRDENPIQQTILPDGDALTLRRMNRVLSFLYFASPYIFAAMFMITAAYINSLSQIFVQMLMSSRDRIFLDEKLQVFTQLVNFSRVNNFTDQQTFNMLNIASGFFIEKGQNATISQIYSCTPSNCTIEGSMLYDIGFDIIQEIKDKNEKTRVADVYMNCMIILTVLRALYFWDRFLRTFRRWLVVHGTLFTIRGLSIAMTVLPNPYKRCTPIITSNPFVSAFLIMIGSNATCADVFFSGHAAMMGLCCMIFTSSMSRRLTLLKILVYIVTFVGWTIIIATRFHYTLDVFYGAVLSIVIWKVYHVIIYANFAKNNIFIVWFEGRRLMSDEEILKREKEEFQANLLNEKITQEIFDSLSLTSDLQFNESMETPKGTNERSFLL